MPVAQTSVGACDVQFAWVQEETHVVTTWVLSQHTADDAPRAVLDEWHAVRSKAPGSEAELVDVVTAHLAEQASRGLFGLF